MVQHLNCLETEEREQLFDAVLHIAEKEDITDYWEEVARVFGQVCERVGGAYAWASTKEKDTLERESVIEQREREVSDAVRALEERSAQLDAERKELRDN